MVSSPSTSVSKPSPSSLYLEEALPYRPRLQRLTKLASLPYLAFIILPLLALFLRISPARLVETLKQSQVLQAIGLSLSTTLFATLLTILFGTFS